MSDTMQDLLGEMPQGMLDQTPPAGVAGAQKTPPTIKKRGNLIISTAPDGTITYFPKKFYKEGVGFTNEGMAEQAQKMTLDKALEYASGRKSFVEGETDLPEGLDRDMKQIQGLVDSGGNKNEMEAWSLMRTLPKETKQAMMDSPRYRKTATILVNRLGLGTDALQTDLGLGEPNAASPSPSEPQGQSMTQPAAPTVKPEWVMHREKLGIPYTWDAKRKAWVPANGQKISV